jgi:hypothetical protein
MQATTANRHRRRAWRTALAALAVCAGVGLVTASPARADNDFRNGFEDQLGRLLAWEVFRVGHVVLQGGYPYYAPEHRARPHPRHRPRWRHDDHHGHRGHPCNHGFDRRSHRGVHDDDVVYERYQYERRRVRAHPHHKRGHGSRHARWRY